MRIITEHPLADWSPDHIHPKGTATDSTRHEGFNRKLFGLFPEVRLLDLGCAGGGLVASIIEDGGTAAGIDGSDYSQATRRAEWGKLPGGILFTADITRPFSLEEDDGSPALFDVVTAWEVLEHIPEELVPAMMGNVANHLVDGGLFVCSISQARDFWEGYDYHVNIHQRDWWEAELPRLGWKLRPDLDAYFDPDWVRGPQRGMDSFAMVISR